MISIVTAILYIIMSDIDELARPSLDKTLSLCDLSGFPYFYGIASFMFEGNAVQLDIYGQMVEPRKHFTRALGHALLFATCLIVFLGAFSYAAYGQYTYGVILLNLEPSLVTYTIQLFYAVGILCGYCLMIIPTFKIIKHIPLYHKVPELSWRGFTHLKSIALRLITLLLCCTLAYNIPDLGQFLNFQGSITGILMTFVFPLACYFKTFEGQISRRERLMCHAILGYGLIGGAISACYALAALLKASKG